jgi:hypothetical protein
MNLESIAKYFAPKSPMFSDSPRATASDSLTGTDVMAALGLAGHKCGFGFDLYLSKIGISSPDIALERLYEQARKLSGKFRALSELDESARSGVLKVLCAFAYQDYSRSAASTRKCDCCDGGGFTEAQVFTNKVSYPWGNRTGRKCRGPFAQATGRAGRKRVRWCGLNASRVTEKALSAIRVAAMAKVRCWTRQKAIARAFQ